MANDETKYSAEANRLYWSNEASVGEIADRFGISRRALYDLIEPRPAGTNCPRCGTEAVFANRSALVSNTARCPACDLEVQVDAVAELRESTPSRDLPGEPGHGWLDQRRIGIGSAALAGAAIGAIAALLLTRRR